MNDEKKLNTRAAGADVSPEPAAAAQGGHRPVLKYLLILFAIAFLLIIFSFVMQQRSNEKVIRDLQDQVETLMELKDVERKYKVLTSQHEDLQLEFDEQTAEKELLEKNLDALNLVWQLERQYTSGDNEACAEILKQLKENDLYTALPQWTGEGRAPWEAPYDAYVRIDAAINGTAAE